MPKPHVPRLPWAPAQLKSKGAPQLVVEATPNLTGLPDALKTGVEALSGLAMDDVRVHRNSFEPAKLGALAYAKGGEIHLGPGQEQHLPHEAWHVVQQKQGRVRATGQVDGIALNGEAALEHEAETMGTVALRGSALSGPAGGIASEPHEGGSPPRRGDVLQGYFQGDEDDISVAYVYVQALHPTFMNEFGFLKNHPDLWGTVEVWLSTRLGRTMNDVVAWASGAPAAAAAAAPTAAAPAAAVPAAAVPAAAAAAAPAAAAPAAASSASSAPAAAGGAHAAAPPAASPSAAMTPAERRAWFLSRYPATQASEQAGNARISLSQQVGQAAASSTITVRASGRVHLMDGGDTTATITEAQAIQYVRQAAAPEYRDNTSFIVRYDPARPRLTIIYSTQDRGRTISIFHIGPGL